MANDTAPPLVGVIMGSKSDWETMAHAAETLERLGVPHEVRVVSAHRTPDLLFEYASSAEARGLAFTTRDTVWPETAARRATSAMETRRSIMRTS